MWAPAYMMDPRPHATNHEAPNKRRRRSYTQQCISGGEPAYLFSFRLRGKNPVSAVIRLTVNTITVINSTSTRIFQRTKRRTTKEIPC
jgi:hypothetical protein